MSRKIVVENDNTIGRRLRQARDQLGLTREDLASKCGGEYSAARINFMETGRTVVVLKIAVELAAVLGISTRWLLAGEGEMMADDQYFENLKRQAFERGLIGKEQFDTLNVLKEFGIRNSEQLRETLEFARRFKIAAEDLPVYRTKKKGDES